MAPALLKLNVQGFELQGWPAARMCWSASRGDVLERSFQALCAGQSFADEVIAWLRERGLRLARVHHMAYDDRGRAVQADYLFGR